MKTRIPHCLACPLLVLLVTACGQSPEPSQAPGVAGTSESGTAAPVISAPAAASGTTGLPGDHATTRRYKIQIDLPALPGDEQPLEDALRTTADTAKREFLKMLPDPDVMPARADWQFQLLLDFKVVANTSVFTSVRETGAQDTGGAHPIPVEAAFVFDRKAGQLISLDDLFVQPEAARKALANFAHDTLLKRLMANAPKPDEGSPEAIREWKTNMVQMLNEGTKPTSVNYSLFVVRAGDSENAPSPGLTLIFPPYQVAPYVYGTQKVEVPASVFAAHLKPGYQGAFAAR